MSAACKLTPGLARLKLSASTLEALRCSAQNKGPLAALDVLVSSGHVRADESQSTCVGKLQTVWDAAKAYAAAHATRAAWSMTLRQRTRSLRSQTQTSAVLRRQHLQDLLALRPEQPVLTSRGLYLWGGVGRGKSLLMDILATSFATNDCPSITVSRQHYHEFMHALHQRLHSLRQLGSARNAVDIAAAEVRRGCLTVLCLDEFQVTSIADAVILRSLFSGLLSNNVMIVTTSNRPPEDLYKNGLNHMLYMPPFIRLLQTSIGVHHVDTQEDFRVAKARADVAPRSGISPDFCVVSPETLFDQTAASESERNVSLVVAWGREIRCRDVREGVAFFSFDELCGSALSAEDYMALIESNSIHTVSVSGVPRFTPELHNEARRFTNLVDCLYESQCRLLCTAAASPEELMADMSSMTALPSTPQVLTDCTAGLTDVRVAELDLADARLTQPDAYSGVDPTNVDSVMGVMSAASASLEESGFAAKRCVSRLQEMGTADYRDAHRIKWALD